MITISIVSHGHCEMILPLLEQLNGLDSAIAEVIVTNNIPSDVDILSDLYSFEVMVINNAHPKGFGANHNQAFSLSRTALFCVLNPDVEFFENPFKKLLQYLSGDSSIGVIAPAIVDATGNSEDSIRLFPTPISILKKALLHDPGTFPIVGDERLVYPDWVAGMFMVFRSDAYRTLGGFDEGYFMYYEDIDMCVRSWKEGYSVVAVLDVRVVHKAQRASHKNLGLFQVHLRSMALFFWRHAFRLPKRA